MLILCRSIKSHICSFQFFFFKAITKEMFEEALHALADDDFLTVTGRTVRLL